MKIPKKKAERYGIVVDSGSSGSRVQVFKWQDQNISKQTKDDKVLKSPPKIKTPKESNMKISPGISTYGAQNKVNRLWEDHFSKLMDFAKKKVPSEKHSETPVFVLATAGMRLLQPKKQKEVMQSICSSLQKNTDFFIPNCEDYVQVIDGETEGIYGWLGLNYLMGTFDDFDSSSTEHESIGFMDMGGASTQIAFVPSAQEEINKHKDDLSKVTLRSINGDLQSWDVFVVTWLGFGANKARERYLNQLIDISVVNPTLDSSISDPCMPKSASIEYTYSGKKYTINGIGNHDMCLRTIYPLLLKNVPCKEFPCLFNGVHGPKLDFNKDKFIGISEYWYTANDVFQSGGEYNYHSFNEKVRSYCESEWSDILKNSENGQYSNLDSDTFLKDACFKASWVINVLHEGFELPRIGIEAPKTTNPNEEKVIEDIDKTHTPFKSADSVNGEELSWTLGKILLFASSQIEHSQGTTDEIGIYPSEISGKTFVPGGLLHNDVDSDDDNDNYTTNAFLSLIVIVLVITLCFRLSRVNLGGFSYKFQRLNLPSSTRRLYKSVVMILPFSFLHYNDEGSYQNIRRQEDLNINLEEGLMSNASRDSNDNLSSVLRTRSTASLFDQSTNSRNKDEEVYMPRNAAAFLNKPFVIPKRSSPNSLFQASENTSRESLSRSFSNSSVQRTKTLD